MLPGLRFLFAATLMCTSLLLFGMGAIALMRASHQQFASLPPRPAPEPVFAQAPETIPSLSMLRAEPAATQPAVPPADRTAALTSAERGVEPPFPVPSFPQPEAAEPAAETRSDAVPPADPPPMPEVTPLAEKPPAFETPAITVTEASAQTDKALEPAQPDTTPAAPSPQFASSPDLNAAPEITGSTSPPSEPLPAAMPVADPPLPLPRPTVAALPADAAPSAAKPVVKRRVHHAKRAAPKSEKLPAVTSAPTLGSLFSGGGSSN